MDEEPEAQVAEPFDTLGLVRGARGRSTQEAEEQ